jgi:hypothetical protein
MIAQSAQTCGVGSVMMSIGRLIASGGLCIALSGCVIGSGPCLWLQVRRTFTGHVHFRDFPVANGIDNAPILVLDKTVYVYSPSQSFHCLAANDVQLVGVSEFPQSVGENTHISVDGKVRQGVAAGQHTQFVIDVISVMPIGPPP